MKSAALITALFFVPTTYGSDWPCFRGPNRNGIIAERLELLPGGPKKLWETSVGDGNGSMAVVDSRLYTMARRPENSIVCLDANTGDRIWLTALKTWSRDPTPAVENGFVYAFPSEQVARAYCLNAQSGRVLWERTLPKSTGDRQYGHAGSPLLWQDFVILNAGGGVALRKKTGEVAWSHEGFPGLATPVAFQWKNRACVAIFGGDHLIARDAHTGAELFRISRKTELAVNACDPIILGERIFLCSNYGVAPAMYDFSAGEPKLLWQLGKNEGHAYSSGFALDDQIYCFGSDKFLCLDPDTGKARWQQPGGGSALLIGDKLLRVRSRGELSIAEISPQAYREKLSANLGMIDIKAVPAYSQGRIFVRNEKGVLMCWQIGR